MPKIDVYDIKGKKVSDVELAESVFGIEPNEAIVHSVLVNYLANQRQGTQSTKTRAEVRGGGRKPWRQKGTGRARQGSIRAPQWIKGGIALEGAKIINHSKKWYNAYYGRYPLTDINVINAGYSLIGANIINNSDKEYKALFASIALCSEYTGNVVNIAKKINTSSDWKTACEILDKYLINDRINLKEDTLYKDESYSLLTNNKVRRRVKY